MGAELKYYCDHKRHLVCIPYSIQNMNQMADTLFINRVWFHRCNNPHYDIPKLRVKEIMGHCTVVSSKEIIEIIKGKLK